MWNTPSDKEHMFTAVHCFPGTDNSVSHLHVVDNPQTILREMQ